MLLRDTENRDGRMAAEQHTLRGWRRTGTTATAAVVLLSVTANQAFACTDACLKKIGGVYTVDGVHYTYESCRSETVGTTVYITCYYGPGAPADQSPAR